MSAGIALGVLGVVGGCLLELNIASEMVIHQEAIDPRVLLDIAITCRDLIHKPQVPWATRVSAGGEAGWDGLSRLLSSVRARLSSVHILSGSGLG